MRNPATKIDEVLPVSKRPRSRFLWNAAGSLFLVLGLIGIPLPILPTTPFLLLAAACYFRGSPRMHRWMMTNRYFGTYLKDYRAGQGIPLKTKVSAIALLWLGIGTSVVLLLENLVVRIVLLVIGVAVTVHIALTKTKKATTEKRANHPKNRPYSSESLDPLKSTDPLESLNLPDSRNSASAFSNNSGRLSK